MNKLKYLVLFTLIALLAVSPGFAQSNSGEADIILLGVIARGNQFASLLRVYTPSSTSFDMVWSEDGRVLYQTPAFERIVGVDPSGDMLVIQRDGTLFLGSITAGSYHELREYSKSHGYFDVSFTDAGTFYVLAIVENGEMEWEHTLSHYSMSGELIGEWQVPEGYMFVESYSEVGRYVILQEMPEGGPRIGIDLVNGFTFVVDHFYSDPLDLNLERTSEVPGSMTTLNLCRIDQVTGECVPGTEYNSTEPTTFTDRAYIYRPVQVPGTNLFAGFGWASGLNVVTFVVIDNVQQWTVEGWFDDPPSAWLYYGSDLPSFAIDQQGEAALVWGSWVSGYQIRRAFLTEAVEGHIPVEDITEALLPNYGQILDALPQQG